jgi:roadblock/LC7 domain-containing protein
MSLVADLAAKPGVIAAGEYSYRGDRFTFKGELDAEWARLASIMCRATTMSTTMAARTAAALVEDDAGLVPIRGWVMRGAHLTICVVANVFCMLDNESASVNAVMADMQTHLGAVPEELV